MSDSKYYTIVTALGLQKIQDRYKADKTVNLTHMGFGGDGHDIALSDKLTTIPHQWATIPLEWSSDDGFIGGGATLEGVPAYKDRCINVYGIYDDEGDLILIASCPAITIAVAPAIISAYPLELCTILDNASHVVVVTDTSIVHPTIDAMHTALRDLYVQLSKYATTDNKGLSELATQAEVDQKKSGNRVVTVDTLDKPALIKSLQDFAVSAANKVEEKIYGGVPVETLDTIKEVSDALLDTGDAVSVMFNRIANLEARLTTTTLTLRKIEGKVGRVRLYMRNDIDDDYLPIRGQTIRKSDYPDYFAHLNITAETLRLPNWSTHGYIRQFSDTLAAGVTLEQEILQHNHTATIGNGGGHTPTAHPVDLGAKSGTFTLNKRFWTENAGAHSHPISGVGDVIHQSGNSGFSAVTNQGTAKRTGQGGDHAHYVDVNFGDVTVSIDIGSYTPILYPVAPHAHVAYIANTGGDENRPKTTVAVYAVKVKYLTAIN